MNAESRRALGYGLLAGAAGVAVLLLAWLLVSGVQTGGFVLGLLLLFVLAGPLAGIGWYVLASGRAEGIAEQAFAGKRRIVDADRLFRDELTRQLRQLAPMPNLPRAQLLWIADGLDRAVKDESTRYAAIQLDDAQAAVLKQYDDLVWERVRWLRDHTGERTGPLADAVNELQAALDQRSDLLLRGRQVPAMSAGALLQAPQLKLESTSLVALAPGDAITHDGTDYLTEAVATSFSDGQGWKLAHLTPSGANAGERWLSISPAGLELAWLEAIPAPQPGANQIVLPDCVLELGDTTSAIVGVATTGGSAPGVLVRSWSYRSGPHRGLVEQWPDGTTRAYAGRSISASELEVWPASHIQEVSRSTP
jgi:hypothetical protein